MTSVKPIPDGYIRLPPSF